jgi:hypothetical protein
LTISLSFFGAFFIVAFDLLSSMRLLHKGWEVYLKAINNADAFAAH